MIWQDFQRPAQVDLEEEGQAPTFGRFLAQPFERGWGTTLGNSLRRALLSSIPSAAITAVKIEGAEGSEAKVPFGEMKLLPLPADGEARVTVTATPERGFDVGAGRGRPVTREVRGGVVGLIVDARGRRP